MNTFRQIIVRFKDKRYLDKFYYYLFKYLRKLNKRNYRINYKKSNRNIVEVKGYDNKIKFKFNHINSAMFNSIIRQTDKMPMRKLDYLYYKPSSLKNICNLSSSVETSHCFKDLTHQTCCLLGYKARRYADKTGNSIGKLSEDMFRKYFNRNPTREDLTPWCTCVGSNVCSYYANKFNDGTHIKFINNYKNNYLAYKIKISCEKTIQKNFNYPQHNTPGINSFTSDLDCTPYMFHY